MGPNAPARSPHDRFIRVMAKMVSRDVDERGGTVESVRDNLVDSAAAGMTAYDLRQTIDAFMNIEREKGPLTPALETALHAPDLLKQVMVQAGRPESDADLGWLLTDVGEAGKTVGYPSPDAAFDAMLKALTTSMKSEADEGPIRAVVAPLPPGQELQLPIALSLAAANQMTDPGRDLRLEGEPKTNGDLSLFHFAGAAAGGVADQSLIVLRRVGDGWRVSVDPADLAAFAG